MSINPVLLLLALVLLMLLARAVGLRRRHSAVGPISRMVRVYRTMAKRNPKRFAPGLALNLKLLSVELAESGRPITALATVMDAVDIYRALSREDPERYAGQLRDAVHLEDKLKDVIGFDPGADIRDYLAAEETARRNRLPSRLEHMERAFWGVMFLLFSFSIGVFAYLSHQAGSWPQLPL